MNIVLVIAIIAAAVALTYSQTHTRYLPVGASSRRYLPTGRSPTRNQSPRRQAEPTGLYLPPDEDSRQDLPSSRAIDNVLSGPYPPAQPQREYQPVGAQRSQNPSSEQGASRRYQPTSSGAPSTNRGQSRGQKTYLPPSGYSGDSGDSGPSEPASYDFEYRVEDAESGNSFGHRESRRGDSVTGAYRVLLPDGRTQVVDYVADQGGYQPKVSYEGNVRAAEGANGGYRYKRFYRY